MNTIRPLESLFEAKKKARKKFIRRERDFGRFISFLSNKCVCFFALIRISVYRVGQNNLHNPSEHWQNVSKKAHAQLRNTQLTKTHFYGPYGRINWYTSIYIQVIAN